MARQRPMSTKTGVPTAATYVFVNMLRKLRDDFSPEYLAAVFDVGAPTIRNQQAEAITTIRKFDIKTQTFKEAEYGGYKANRAEMPGDLVQQIPYIRRALEGYRIPILQLEGYEADDVIGTLARKAAAESYPVFVVSSDKDMLQLVDDKVQVLNPPKDNLICDAAKVEELLGVPPSKVVDVMALRGDAVDNIPGAPGIGDKGSVELIQRFGSVEQALERAAEVEKKTYRESLQNNRDNILYSKQLVTIDTDVAVELNVAAMKADEPDVESLRALFAELEFTSLLKELLPVIEVKEGDYREIKSKAEFEEYLRGLDESAVLALAIPTEHTGLFPEDTAERRRAAAGAVRSFWLCSLRMRRIRAPAFTAHCRFECAGGWGDGRAGRRGARRSSEKRARRRRSAEDDSRFQVCASPFFPAGELRWPECGMIRCSIPTCSIPPTPRIRCRRWRCGDSI